MAKPEQENYEIPPEIGDNIFSYSLPDGTHVYAELHDSEGNPVPCDQFGNPLHESPSDDRVES